MCKDIANIARPLLHDVYNIRDVKTKYMSIIDQLFISL